MMCRGKFRVGREREREEKGELGEEKRAEICVGGSFK